MEASERYRLLMADVYELAGLSRRTSEATAPFFASLSAEERARVAARFTPRRFGRGARILDEGAPGGGLYLILVGEVDLARIEEVRRNWPFLRDRRIDAYGGLERRFLD